MEVVKWILSKLDFNTVLTLLLFPLGARIWTGIMQLLKDVAICKQAAGEWREWKDKKEDLEDIDRALEIRMARIENALLYIIPGSVTDAKIAQIFSDSLRQPVDKSVAKTKTTN